MPSPSQVQFPLMDVISKLGKHSSHRCSEFFGEQGRHSEGSISRFCRQVFVHLSHRRMLTPFQHLGTCATSCAQSILYQRTIPGTLTLSSMIYILLPFAAIFSLSSFLDLSPTEYLQLTLLFISGIRYSCLENTVCGCQERLSRFCSAHPRMKASCQAQLVQTQLFPLALHPN